MKNMVAMTIMLLYILFVNVGLACIAFWLLAMRICVPVDNNQLWVGVCILVGAMDLFVGMVAVIGTKQKKNHGTSKKEGSQEAL